jgi:hypothetical protein
MYAGVATTHERGRRTKCHANLAGLLYTVQLYIGDNVPEGSTECVDDRFRLAPSPPNIDALFGSYLTDAELLLCPSASKATEMTDLGFLRHGVSGASGSIYPEHTDYVFVSGLLGGDPPDYVVAFDDEWNHDGDGVNVASIGGRCYWTDDIKALHEKLAKQDKELAAQGREMKLLRPAWSAWSDPSVSSDPRAGPWPWYRRRNGSAVLVGASVGFVAALVMAVVMFSRRRRRGQAGIEGE